MTNNTTPPQPQPQFPPRRVRVTQELCPYCFSGTDFTHRAAGIAWFNCPECGADHSELCR